MAAAEIEELEAGARAAVLVRRSDLPVPLAHPARSFFGGLPRLPLGVIWPKADVEADGGTETVALTFIAQIDLAELPASEVKTLLPPTGTLYFFCSSIFEGEGSPPCRILHHPGSANALAQTEPPPDLMVLAGGSDYQVEWLDPASDFHAKVEFKYPLSFLPFRDFAFQQGPVGGELLVRSLCETLGPGVAEERDLLLHRTADDFAADEDWPFNWLLITYVARSVLAHVKSDLEVSSWRKPLDDETRRTLQGFAASANEWIERAARSAALQGVDAGTKPAFRAWWSAIVRTYAQLRDRVLTDPDRFSRVSTSPHQFTGDVGHAIDHTIRFMSARGDLALAPGKYLANLQTRNHWKAPGARAAQSRFFSTALHQIGGHGGSWQDAPAEHGEDVLLLQIQGDDAFLGWHENSGCVLHFWIDRDALAELDFSEVEATLECD